jgi:hypothetical protein
MREVIHVTVVVKPVWIPKEGVLNNIFVHIIVNRTA